MSYEAIARRYARAIFDLAKEAGAAAAVARELTELAGSYEGSEELASVLGNPLIENAAREAVLREITARMGTSETTRNALLLLLRKRRIAAVGDVARQLTRMLDEDTGVVRATVTSAAPLSEAYLGKLRGELEKATKKKVVITHEIDPSLIAGVVTRIGDRVVDGSVRARLSRFRDATPAS